MNPIKPTGPLLEITDFYERSVLQDAVMLLSEIVVEQRYMEKAPVPMLTKAIVTGPVGRGEKVMFNDSSAVLACHLIDDEGSIVECTYIVADVSEERATPVHEVMDLDVADLVRELRESAENGYDLLPAA